jgi:serine/tyrosine/threonine adenylyltransferase
MNLSNSYRNLDSRFFEQATPVAVSGPELFLWNDDLASLLGIDKENDFSNAEEVAQLFSGNRIAADSSPVALVYAGHQFGQFNPQLGDGRAHLLGEIEDRNGKTRDMQLKGSGPTSFSRGGDGRCAIGPAVREFLMSEAIHALGVPTSRCLSVVTTGESVYRESVMPGAIVCRVAASHLRVGSFQFFAARQDTEALQALRDFAIEKHCPQYLQEPNKSELLLQWVIEKQISLLIEWMRVGFIHGVLNTDNTSISGETIDYGPCAMMGVYDPKTVYSSIDHGGRYAYGNQPNIIHWNLARFVECILPLAGKADSSTVENIENMIAEVPDGINEKYSAMMANKFGLRKLGPGDGKLMTSLLQIFLSQKLDYTNTFDLLTRSLDSDDARDKAEVILGDQYSLWRQRLDEQDVSIEQGQSLMRQNNPLLIPRNHHVEAAIKECEENLDPSAVVKMLEALRSPYEETEFTSLYQDLPEDGDSQYKTFCGT